MITTIRVLLVILTSLIFQFSEIRNLWAENNEEEIGVGAEKAGDFERALEYYVRALQMYGDNPDFENDLRLREHIFAVVSKMKSPPTVPEEARRSIVKGKKAMDEAQTDTDYLWAANEFGSALRVAPWLTETYLLLADAEERAGRYDAAKKSLECYLLGERLEKDKRKIQDKIYELEYLNERTLLKNINGMFREMVPSGHIYRYQVLVDNNLLTARYISALIPGDNQWYDAPEDELVMSGVVTGQKIEGKTYAKCREPGQGREEGIILRAPLTGNIIDSDTISFFYEEPCPGKLKGKKWEIRLVRE